VQGLIGLIGFLAFAWLLSEDRRAVSVRQLAIALLIQVVLAYVLLNIGLFRQVLLSLNEIVYAMEAATREGTQLVFGFLGGDTNLPFELTADSMPYIFAFRVLPQILVFSVVVALLWHWRVLPVVIRGFSWALRRSLGVGGAVGVAASASVFLGMVEAPLVIRAYLRNLSRSELFVVMTCGMSTVAGSIMVLYANVLAPVIEGAIGHVLTASVVNVVGAVLVSRILIPEEGITEGGDLADALSYESSMDAVSRGTMDGVKLVVNVGAMVIVLMSLVGLVNYVLGNFMVSGEPLTLQWLAGWIFAPIAWVMGVDWVDARTAGALMGTKLILNELVAYLEFGALADSLLPDTRLILTYALCGFTNFGSLGILIGGVSALVPERRKDLLTLGPKTLLSGTLVACLTGTIVGIVG
jgi:CNT family concentrative nucleoside transporter